jgi:hypothetical protein
MATDRELDKLHSCLTQPEQPNPQLMEVLRWHPRQTHVPIIRPGFLDLPDDRDDRIRVLATEAFERNAPQLWRRIFDHLDTDQWDITPILYDIVDVFEKSNGRTLRFLAAFVLVYARVPIPDDLQYRLWYAVSDEEEDVKQLFLEDGPWTMHPREWTTLLLAAMTHPQPKVRIAAMRRWSMLSGRVATAGVESLIRGLQDQDEEVRTWALIALTRLNEHAKSAVPLIVNCALATHDGTFRSRCLRSILRTDSWLPLARESLAKVLEPASRQAVLLALLDIENWKTVNSRSFTDSVCARSLRQELQQRWENGPSRSPESSQESQQHPDGPDGRSRERSPESSQESQQHANGPDCRSLEWWWEGKSWRLAEMPFRMLSYLWLKEVAGVPEVEKYVWGPDEQEYVTKTNLKTQLSRANKALKETHTPYRYHRQGSQIVRRPC